MTLKKAELVDSSNHDQIFKMHVYILVWLKLDRIRFLIVRLKHLDYSIGSSRFYSWGHEPEVEGRWWRLSPEITTCKSTIVHLVCVIIMYTIYEMYKDVASSCSCSFSNAEAEFVVAGDVQRSAGGGSITTSWNVYSAAHRTGVWHSANNLIFSLACTLRLLQLSDWVA